MKGQVQLGRKSISGRGKSRKWRVCGAFVEQQIELGTVERKGGESVVDGVRGPHTGLEE